LWGYGYYVPFAGMAALGGGLEVVVAAGAGHGSNISTTLAVTSVAAPVGVVIIMVELLRVAPGEVDVRSWLIAGSVAAALVEVVSMSPRAGLVGGMCLVALIAVVAVVADATRPLMSRNQL
jgi:hypothetical protein